MVDVGGKLRESRGGVIGGGQAGLLSKDSSKAERTSAGGIR